MCTNFMCGRKGVGKFLGYCLPCWAELPADHRSKLIALNDADALPPVRVVTSYQIRPPIPLWLAVLVLVAAGSLAGVAGSLAMLAWKPCIQDVLRGWMLR